MSDNELTERQIKIYNLIKEKTIENGFPPTVREITGMLGSKSLFEIHKDLIQLEKMGYIKNSPDKPRTHVIKKDLEGKANGVSVFFVPIISKLNPEKNNMETIGFFPYVNETEKLPKFAYRMKGYSLIQKGIFEKDLLFFSEKTPVDGEIVIAYADSATIVAELAHDENENIYFKVSNSAMSDIYPNSCTICGSLSAVMRFFKHE